MDLTRDTARRGPSVTVLPAPVEGSAARNSPTVSVVVCAYTMARWELLASSLDSARRQTWTPLEVILVVDHCPELLARAEELGPDIRVVSNSADRGLSGARNTGVAAASGDVVAFLDDDASAEPTWLEHLMRHYADSSVVGVGGRVEPVWADAKPVWFPPEFGWVVGCSYRGQPVSTAPVRNPIGANMSFRRESLESVGGFSSVVGRVGTRPVGCEETELSIRVARSDPRASILLEPAAVVRHHVPGDRATWSYFRRRCWSEGLSKAAVSRLTDPRSALATERSYVTRVLSRGAAEGLLGALRGADRGGFRRAMAIGAGLVMTSAGYVAGKARGFEPADRPV